MEEVWKNWKELNQITKGKDVVFFGVSEDWVVKTIDNSGINPKMIVDNSKAWIGEKFKGIQINAPDALNKLDKKYVVITSGGYSSVIPQLVSYGLKPGKDFCCSPALNNLRIISELHDCDTKLLISSPDHKIYSELDEDSEIGGGIYVFDIKKNKLTKKLNGTFHQIVKTDDGYYLLDEMEGGMKVTKDFKIVKKGIGFEKGSRSHGIAFCPKRKLIFIAKSGLDKISVYDANNYEHIRDIMMSDKMEKYDRPQHHINDVYVHKDYLYVSLFSHTGNYQRGINDGGILEIDIDDPDKRNVLINGAWMPHSVCVIGKDICYLDSMTGNFYKSDRNIVSTFSGFVRGLDFDGKYYYIGQSETRYFDRLRDHTNYISMSAGIYLFDEDSKAGKFFSMPQIRQIRDLVVI